MPFSPSRFVMEGMQSVPALGLVLVRLLPTVCFEADSFEDQFPLFLRVFFPVLPDSFNPFHGHGSV